MKVRQLISALKRAKKNADVCFWNGDAPLHAIKCYSSTQFKGENDINKHDDEFWIDLQFGPNSNKIMIKGYPEIGEPKPRGEPVAHVSKVRHHNGAHHHNSHSRHVPVVVTKPLNILERALAKVKEEKDVPDGKLMHRRGKV